MTMRLALAFGLPALFTAAFADHIDTGIRLANWRINTSENLWIGARHRSYPIENLFDGKLETAWCYSGIDYLKPMIVNGFKLRGELLIHIRPDKPTLIDEIKLWNGYQKSVDLFLTNSRASKIQIYDSHPKDWLQDGTVEKWRKPVLELSLEDSMEAISIELPPKRYRELYIRIAGFRKGSVDDLCLSELTLLWKGKSLIQPPTVFTSTDGDECG